MRKLVLGIGNILLKDEGIGCHVVHALQQMSLADAEIIDGGTRPDILFLIEGVDKLIVVDAVRGGGMPGQIYKFGLRNVARECKPSWSLHDMSVLDALLLTRPWRNGDITVIGIEPKEIDWGLELSAEVREKIPQIIEIILAELNKGAKERENADLTTETD